MLFLPFSWVEFGLGKIPLVKRFFVRELKRASCVEGTDVFGAALVGAAVVGVALTGIAVAGSTVVNIINFSNTTIAPALCRYISVRG